MSLTLKASSHCVSMTIKLCWNRINLGLTFIVIFMQLNLVLVGKTCGIIWYGNDQCKGFDLRKFYFNICLDFFTSQTVLLNTVCHYNFICQWFENAPGYIEDHATPFWCTFSPFCDPGLAVGLDPQGYGNPDFCWLSVHDTLIWSFAGPIVIVVVVSMVELASWAVSSLLLCFLFCFVNQ